MSNPFEYTPVQEPGMTVPVMTICLNPPSGIQGKLATVRDLFRIAFHLLCGRTVNWTIRHVEP